MVHSNSEFENYLAHLQRISLAGRLYKRYFSSPILYLHARRFGSAVVEIGSGIGSGCLGAFPRRVSGLEINLHAVDYCQARGLNAQLIPADGQYPMPSASCNACILDNVLEHISHPVDTLDECHRITTDKGGLVIAVPGLAGYASDNDHKKFYDAQALQQLDRRWRLSQIFSTPFGLKNEQLSKTVRQYCLVAVYQKI